MSQLNTISPDHLIAQATIDTKGNFSFQFDLLKEGDQLFRIHFVKKGDPPGTLIIGGREHNHFFLFGGKGAKVMCRINSRNSLLESVRFEGYGPIREHRPCLMDVFTQWHHLVSVGDHPVAFLSVL